MAGTLADIRTKIRRLTRSPTQDQLPDIDIDSYVNDFMLNDMPEHLRIFALRTSFSWTCQPNIDTYTTDANASVAALVNFNQNYITVHQPIFIAGQPAYYSEDRGEFYGRYPFVRQINQIGTGNGVLAGAYTFTLQSIPVLQNQVLISSVDINNNALAATDVPTSATTGNLVDTQTGNVLGTINYITGALTITFAVAPMNGRAINAQVVPYVPQRPTAILYFDDMFVLRQVPDQPYTINFDAYIRPTALLNATDTPELQQWWKYIAYGATKLLFQDRSDAESVEMIMPEFMNQERLVNRRTIVQQTIRRTSTIYANQVEYQVAPWGPGDYTF